MKPVYIIGAIIVLMLGIAGGFYGGVVYAQSQSQNSVADFARQRGGAGSPNAQGAAAGPCGFVGRNGGGAGGGGFFRQGQGGGTPSAGQGQGQGGNAFQQLGQCVARGQVKSVDPSTGTVQISTPVNVVTVKVTSQTAISKTDSGSLSDITVGERVAAFSLQPGDTPTASAIQIQRAPGQTTP